MSNLLMSGKLYLNIYGTILMETKYLNRLFTTSLSLGLAIFIHMLIQKMIMAGVKLNLLMLIHSVSLLILIVEISGLMMQLVFSSQLY